ncbi:MAG: twin-arginine translocase subunit TatC [Candidatus Paceibacterota bacterium]
MTLVEELKIFVKNIMHWIYSLVAFSFFFFIFGLKEVMIFGTNYFLPLPSENSFSVQVFNQIRQDLLPSGVQLVVTNPMSAFVYQILISILLSFLLNIPFFIYKIIIYLRPALLPHEKKAVLWSLLPSAFLFFAGCVFSYFFLIPTTFKILYPYAVIMGVLPFFSLDEFIYYVFSLMFGVGLMFLLPLFMILLSFTGIIKAEFWRSKWRYALLFFLVLSAIITPDGTGITMAMLFIPLSALYFVGYVFSKRSN